MSLSGVLGLLINQCKYLTFLFLLNVLITFSSQLEICYMITGSESLLSSFLAAQSTSAEVLLVSTAATGRFKGGRPTGKWYTYLVTRSSTREEYKVEAG
jgi:hypothetical protein